MDLRTNAEATTSERVGRILIEEEKEVVTSTTADPTAADTTTSKTRPEQQVQLTTQTELEVVAATLAPELEQATVRSKEQGTTALVSVAELELTEVQTGRVDELEEQTTPANPVALEEAEKTSSNAQELLVKESPNEPTATRSSIELQQPVKEHDNLQTVTELTALFITTALPEIEVTETPELIPNTPVLVTDTPGLVIETPGLAANTPELVTNTPGLLVNSPELIPNTPGLVTETPGLAANTPELVTNTPGLLVNNTELMTDTPELARNTPEFITNTPEIITNTPGLAANTPDLATNTPELEANTPDLVTNTPDLVTNTLELVANTSGLGTNSPGLEISRELEADLAGSGSKSNLSLQSGTELVTVRTNLDEEVVGEPLKQEFAAVGNAPNPSSDRLSSLVLASAQKHALERLQLAPGRVQTSDSSAQPQATNDRGIEITTGVTENILRSSQFSADPSQTFSLLDPESIFRADLANRDLRGNILQGQQVASLTDNHPPDLIFLQNNEEIRGDRGGGHFELPLHDGPHGNQQPMGQLNSQVNILRYRDM